MELTIEFSITPVEVTGDEDTSVKINTWNVNTITHELNINADFLFKCLSPLKFSELCLNLFNDVVKTNNLNLKSTPVPVANFSGMWPWDTIPATEKQFVTQWLEALLPQWKSGMGGPK